MTDQYKMGIYVMDYLQSLGFNMSTIGQAIQDGKLENSYKLIQDNPKITNIKTIWSTQITIYLVK